jgi:hypothetical protein
MTGSSNEDVERRKALRALVEDNLAAHTTALLSSRSGMDAPPHEWHEAVIYGLLKEAASLSVFLAEKEENGMRQVAPCMADTFTVWAMDAWMCRRHPEPQHDKGDL